MGQCISSAMYKDVRAARMAQVEETKPYRVVRLTKAGKHSKVASDTVRFYLLSEAQGWVENFTRLNPSSGARFEIIFS